MTVSDGGASIARLLTFTVSLPITMTDAILSVTESRLVTYQVLSANGGGSRTYMITGGSMPLGLGLIEQTGIVTGTPTVTGTYMVTIAVADAYSSASASLTLTITPPGNYQTAQTISDQTAQACVTQYQTLVTAGITLFNQKTATRLLETLCVYVYRTNSTSVLNAIYQLFVTYQSTALSERNALSDIQDLNPQTQSMVFLVYTTFMSVVTQQNPQSTLTYFYQQSANTTVYHFLLTKLGSSNPGS
jgi:hypothetical protein